MSAVDNPRLSRTGAWMGIVFVVLFVIGFIVFPIPGDNKDTVKWQSWWNDSGHRTGAILGAYLMVLGVLAFVWFAWNLRHHLQDRYGLHDRGGLMFAFATLFAAVAMVSTLVRASIPGAKQFGDTPLPTGDFARQFDQIGFALLLVAGALSAGAFVAVASLLARQSGALPAWLTTAGFVVAVLQLAASLFLPFALFLLWVLAISIVLVKRESRATNTASTRPSS